MYERAVGTFCHASVTPHPFALSVGERPVTPRGRPGSLRIVKESSVSPSAPTIVAIASFPSILRKTDPNFSFDTTIAGWFKEPGAVIPALPAVTYTVPLCGSLDSDRFVYALAASPLPSPCSTTYFSSNSFAVKYYREIYFDRSYE